MQVGHAGGVARVADVEGNGVLQPIVPDTIGIVRRHGKRVLPRAEFAPEGKCQFQPIARVAGTELELFQLRIGAVYVEPDAGADHDTYYGIGHRFTEEHGHPYHGALAAAPDHGGLAILADGLDAQDLGASIAAADRGGERRGDALAPAAQAGGDVLAILRQHFLGIAAAGQPALVQPPDLVGEPADQFLFVRHHQRGGSGAAYAVERYGGALAHDQVLVAEGAVDEQHRRGREIQRIVRAQPADVARGFDGARRGTFQSGGEPQQAAFAGAVLADDADYGSIRRDHVQVLQRRAGDVAKCKRHKR